MCGFDGLLIFLSIAHADHRGCVCGKRELPCVGTADDDDARVSKEDTFLTDAETVNYQRAACPE